MKTNYKVAIALVTGAAIGGAVIQEIHAQAKPPVYVIQEINVVSNRDAYLKEYVPKARDLVKSSGGRSIVIGSGKITPIEGAPPKGRFVIQQWESMEKFQAYFNSAENKVLRKIGDKYAKFRLFAVEGVPQ